MPQERPKISVVTVNFNMAAVLGPTIESILGQDFPDFELIVIDGGSRDGSRELIESHAARLAFWASEADRNLYHAMNKGVAAARGEWVLFMNAGDCFAAPDVLSRVFRVDHADADLLYGHHIRVYAQDGIERFIPAEMPDVLPMRMACSHQSLFTRRTILVERPLDETLLAADYDSILAAYAAGRKFERVDVVIARTAMAGLSDRQRLRGLGQRFSVVRRQGLMTPLRALRYGLLMARLVAAQALKKMLPPPLLRAILRHRPIKGMG